MLKSVLPMFSSRSFIIADLTFRSVICFQWIYVYCFEFTYVYGVGGNSNFILFFMQLSCFPDTAIEETVFATLYVLAFVSFVIDQLTVSVWVYFWAVYCVPLICVSVFVPIAYCFDDCSFAVQLKSGSLILPAWSFFLKTDLAISGLLFYHPFFKPLFFQVVHFTAVQLFVVAYYDSLYFSGVVTSFSLLI